MTSAVPVVADVVELARPGVDVRVGIGRTPHLELVVSGAGSTAVDVAAHGRLAIATGVHAGDEWVVRVPVVLLEPQFRLTLYGPDREPIAVVEGRNELRPPATQLSPLLVHQLARGGTTVLMRLLAAHPDVAAFGRYPLETRLALSLLHGVAVTAGAYPAEHRPDFIDGAPLQHPTPYLTVDELGEAAAREAFTDGIAALRDGAAAMVDGTYRALRPGARHWAEKFQFESPGAVITQQTALAGWPGTRQVIVLRDPRDLVCSRLSFNAKRSFGSFDLDLDDDHTSAVPVTARHVRLVLEQRAAFPDAAVIRYEDLVTDPVRASTELFRSLGIRYDWSTVRNAVDAATGTRDDQHVTSSSPAASVGRWRDELPEAALDVVHRELGDELERLGYG
jgi:hypothetical protein